MFRIFNNKTFIRIISFALCFFMFFSFTTSVHAGLIDDIKNGIKNAFLDLFDKVLAEISKIIVSFGDGIVHIMARATGEVVTIDKLVFNKVDKVSIDYWNYTNSNATEISTPIKNYMAIPVQKWYKVFNRIAIMVYMIVLVYMGIAIMLSSTGEKRARYKELTMTWVIGIAILFLFPYVMKYTIKLNDALTNMIANVSTSFGFTQQEGTGGDLGQLGFLDVAYEYGKPEFSKHLGNSKDIITFTRNVAIGVKDDGSGNKKTNANIALALVYDVLIGQTLVILIMYYKRAFMMAFLIVIFPLVAMSYVIDKIGDGKSQSFGLWFKEFLVNVVVQTFHAIVYVLITGGGIKSYIDSSGGNFIFMFLCVLFLFEGEKILRGIFGIQSQANTIGDLAATGAMIMAMGGKAKGVFGGGDVKTGSSTDNKENTAATKRVAATTQAKENNEKAAQATQKAKTERGDTSGSHGEYNGEENEPEGVKDSNASRNAQDKALIEAMKRRLNGGAVAKAVSFAAGATGAVMETSKTMATGDIGPDKILGAASAGKSLGKTFATPLVKGINLAERRVSGAMLASKISNGKMDESLGIDKIDGKFNVPAIDNIDENAIAAKGLTKQDIYREALAAYAKKAAVKGGNAGEEAFFNYIEKVTKN
mgnify:CR=1 FL=1